MASEPSHSRSDERSPGAPRGRRQEASARTDRGEGASSEPADFTRESLLGLLRGGPWTAPALARELRISGTAVRKHLDQLRLEELVEEVGVRRGRGRPAILYGLSERGEALFRRDRGEILETVLDSLHETPGGVEARSLLRDAGARLARRMMLEERSRSGGLEGAEPVERALHMLHRLGGRDTARRTAGGTEILGFACPLAEYVEAYPETCHFVAGFTEEVMGRDVRPCCSRRRTEGNAESAVCLLAVSPRHGDGTPDR